MFQLRLLIRLCRVDDGEVVLLCGFQRFPCTRPADDSGFVWGIGIGGIKKCQQQHKKGKRSSCYVRSRGCSSCKSEHSNPV